MSDFTRENGGFNQRTCVLCGEQRGPFRVGDKAWCLKCARKKYEEYSAKHYKPTPEGMLR